MSDGPEYMTREKYDELTKELHILSTECRKEIAESLEEARSLGDLSENAEYHAARNAQAELEDKIRRLEIILQNAVIIEDGGNKDLIGVGSEVILEKNPTQEKVAYKIVGSEESDVTSGKLSVNSPLGSLLVGKRAGESVEFVAPSGKKITYKIVEVK